MSIIPWKSQGMIDDISNVLKHLVLSMSLINKLLNTWSNYENM